MAIVQHPEHGKLYGDDVVISSKLAVESMLDIVCENLQTTGVRCVEIGAGTGGLARQASPGPNATINLIQDGT